MSNEIPKPCPFCGREEPYVGPESAISVSVKCMGFEGETVVGCQVTMQVHYPYEWPEDIESQTLPDMNEWCAQKAIEKWNRRAS
jgi:hypothetical protein